MITQQSPATSTPSSLQSVRIEISGGGTHTYKSIGDLIWDDIPAFSVLTGLNGSGKTQLLELLAYKLTQTNHPKGIDLKEMKVQVSGDQFAPGTIAYLPSSWEFTSTVHLSIAQMQQAKAKLYEELLRNTNDMRHIAKRAQVTKILGLSDLKEIDKESFLKRLPDDFLFMLDEVNVISGLAHIFLAYRLRFAQELERNVTREDAQIKLGPAPWDVLNETFQAAEFPYRVLSPIEFDLLDTYKLILEDQDSGQRIEPGDLSSGEKMLLGLVMWLYNSQHHHKFPRLFLLDEPDAHLHPSMTRHFLNVIREVLVERYGVRTILTTHSPSTVALAPEEGIFLMSRTQPRITRPASKAAAIGLLTSGFVTVSSSTRYVLVEDAADVEFYNTVRDILTDYGPSKDERAINPEPSLVFLPASLKRGKDNVGGGNTVVSQWVDKFDQAPLNEIIRGIIDRDKDNVVGRRILVLERYSIENYQLDPFVIFALLLEERTAPPVDGVNISAGNEHLIRTFSITELTAILNKIRDTVELALGALTETDKKLREVTFTNGKTISYPAWMLDRRGHDLLSIYQECFGGPKVISPPKLNKMFRRVRFIPSELANIMDRLQDSIDGIYSAPTRQNNMESDQFVSNY